MDETLLRSIMDALRVQTESGKLKWKRERDLSMRVNFQQSSIELKKDKENYVSIYFYNSGGDIADQWVPGRIDEPNPLIQELRGLYELAEELSVQKSQTIEDVLKNLNLKQAELPSLVRIMLVTIKISPQKVRRGEKLTIEYFVVASEAVPLGEIWLGASFGDKSHGGPFHNTKEDKYTPLVKGRNIVSRVLTIPKEAPVGDYTLGAGLWLGTLADSGKSKSLVRQTVPLSVVDD